MTLATVSEEKDTLERRVVERLLGITKKELSFLEGNTIIKDPFLIAGVGSILRLDDSDQAKDIDIVMTGLKHSVINEIKIDWNSDYDTRGYPNVIYNLFEKIVYDFDPRYVLDEIPLIGFTQSFPLWGFDKRVELNVDERKIDIRTLIEMELPLPLSQFLGQDFGGISINYGGCRPIDLFYSLGITVESWKNIQNSARDKDSSEGKSERYFYSTLYES